MSVNKVILIGRAGKDPDVRTLDGGAKVASLSFATTDKAYTLQNGTQVPERTEWHNLIFWNKTAEIVEKYVHKGDKLYIEGKLRTRNYDDSKGVKRYITEVFVDSIEMLTPKVQQQAAPVPPPLPTQQPTQRQQQVQQPAYQQQQFQQASNVKELNWRLWNTCFFRREKSKVLTQLPDKTRQYLTVDITTTKEYKAAEADMVKYLKKYKNASDEQVQKSMNGAVMVQMQLLKQISARGKIKAVCEFVHDVIDGGEKLILFGYLKEVVAELKKEFPKAVTVTGSDNVNQKQYAVDSFQNNPDCKLIILNFKSGGTGLTLTAASRVAFIEFPWTFSDCEQAEDRAHRNGQKNNVNCYYFLGKDTIDKYMYDVIQTKKNIANGVTGTDDQVEENMVNLAMDLFRDKL